MGVGWTSWRVGEVDADDDDLAGEDLGRGTVPAEHVQNETVGTRTWEARESISAVSVLENADRECSRPRLPSAATAKDGRPSSE